MEPFVIGFLVALVIIFLIKLHTKQVIWFYRPDCGHCHNMKPEWDKFSSAMCLTVFPHIETKKIDISDPQNAYLAENYEVSGVPFIVKLEDDGVRNIYNGDRTYGDLSRWVYA